MNLDFPAKFPSPGRPFCSAIASHPGASPDLCAPPTFEEWSVHQRRLAKANCGATHAVSHDLSGFFPSTPCRFVSPDCAHGVFCLQGFPPTRIEPPSPAPCPSCPFRLRPPKRPFPSGLQGFAPRVGPFPPYHPLGRSGVRSLHDRLCLLQGCPPRPLRSVLWRLRLRLVRHPLSTSPPPLRFRSQPRRSGSVSPACPLRVVPVRASWLCLVLRVFGSHGV
jgi:hypothetical protein